MKENEIKVFEDKNNQCFLCKNSTNMRDPTPHWPGCRNVHSQAFELFRLFVVSFVVVALGEKSKIGSVGKRKSQLQHQSQIVCTTVEDLGP